MGPSTYSQPVEALNVTIEVDRISPLPSNHILPATFGTLQNPLSDWICEPQKAMLRSSKAFSKVPGSGPSVSQYSQENILDVLQKEDGSRRLMSLALVLDDQGHPKHAEEAYQKVIEKTKETPEQNDTVIWFCQVKISSILRQSGLYVKAEEQCRSVLDLSTKATGPASSLSLQAAGDLALVWRDQGKFDSALTKIYNILHNETCSPYQDALHVRLVTIYAIILRDFGRYDMSLFLTRNALRVSGVLFGNEDPFTLDLASELSQILTEKGIHHLAEEFARRALDGFAKTFGTDHPQSLKAASRLANAIRFNERLEEATQLFERTLKAQELQLGSTHPDTIPTKCGLAAVYALEARFRDSVFILRVTLAQQNELLGRKSHPDTDWTVQALKRIRALQKALSSDSTPEHEMLAERRRMEDFFEKPFRKDQRSLQRYHTLTSSQKDTGDLRGQSDLQWLLSARDVSTDSRSPLSSSFDKGSVSGIYGTNLHVACYEGDLKLVQTLLDSRVDINVKGGVFETPLCAASYRGHLNIVTLLLKHNVNVNDNGRYGFCATQLALSMDHSDLARTLLEADASYEVTDHWYGNALHEVSMTGKESMVDLLLEAKAEPDVPTGIFGTALGAAAWNGNLAIVEALIAKGADVNLRTKGRTALDLAASRGHKKILEALIREADNGDEAPKSKAKSGTLEQKSLEPDNPVMEDSKPTKQSEPPEQKPLNYPEAINPQTQRQPKQPSTKSSKAERMGAGKWQARKTKTKLGRVATKVKSASKSLIPSSVSWVGRVRRFDPISRKRTPNQDGTLFSKSV